MNNLKYYKQNHGYKYLKFEARPYLPMETIQQWKLSPSR